ncbi:uncharacterized protein LOC108857459 [Raphanus sativus]|uniref:Uncharacterized protein LOC108857459 n=1 Tax=Raphanus sativus TaxID=3726 RepID=A0A6J0NQI2_RAPSA|nr:uncharacterized protein LOC108857459 [Raphanus sativus]
MANDELVKPENAHSSSFRQDHFTGIRHNFELFPTNDYNSDFEQLLDINLQIGASYEENEVWNQFQEHKATALQDSMIHHSDETEQEAVGVDGNQHVSFLSFPDNEVSVTGARQKQESQEIDENLDLSMSNNNSNNSMPPPSSQCWSMSGEHEMSVGKEFPDAKACRRALRDAAISQRFEIQTIKSDRTRFTAKCMSQGCPWRIHCAKLPNLPTFTVRTVHSTHTCGGVSHLGHQQASVQWVADAVSEKLKENPHFKPKQILEEIHRTHGIALSYKQAWRGKERLMGRVNKLLRGGSFEEEYRLLPQYCHEIVRANPGSVALVHANPIDERFQQVFVSFKPSITGFLTSCRPLIALDKAVLKSKYPGTLLVASGFDGDGGVLPLAYAVVSEDNDSSWYQFLTELRKILEVNNCESIVKRKLTILSTMEKSIVDGVEINFPTAFHGFCVDHLAGRFHKEFHSSTLVSLLWEAAHSPTVVEFTSVINTIQQISQEAFLWIQNISPSLWASCYFEGTRFGQLTANVVTESSLKSWIEDVSGLPIVQTMECFHRRLMDLFKERREASSRWSDDDVLVPSAESRMLAAMEKSRGHRVYRANEAEFEVMASEGNVVVDVENRSCLCRRWEVQGLPCSHAVGALLTCEEDVYEYAESCFTAESYRRTYGEAIEAVSESVEWREKVVKREDGGGGGDGIRTPKLKAGRRRVRRVRPEDGDRVKRAVHCSRCQQTGHFRTTCIAPM